MVCGRVSRESRHKIQCRGSFCVGTDTHFGRKSATFRHVADMSPTCRRHSQLRPRRSIKCHRSCQSAARAARATPNHTSCPAEDWLPLPAARLLPLLQICCPAADDTAHATVLLPPLMHHSRCRCCRFAATDAARINSAAALKNISDVFF